MGDQENHALKAQLAQVMSRVLRTDIGDENLVASLEWLLSELSLVGVLALCSEVEGLTFEDCTGGRQSTKPFCERLFSVLQARNPQVHQRMLDWRKEAALKSL